MRKVLGSEVKIKNNVAGKLIGKGYVEQDGKVQEKYIVQIDTKRFTLQDILPYLDQIVIDPKNIVR